MMHRKDFFVLLAALGGQDVDPASLAGAVFESAQSEGYSFCQQLASSGRLSEAQMDAVLSAIEAALKETGWDESLAAQRLLVAVSAPQILRFLEEWTSLSRRSVDERYSRESVLGQGGLGRVWRAVDRQVDRPVALKELRPEWVDNADLRARFLEEARIAGRLQHPNIVPIYDLTYPASASESAASVEGGSMSPYYAMRLIGSRTLENEIADFHAMPRSSADRHLKFRQLVSHLSLLCDAVHYAHSQGVIHRDLKPVNVAIGDFGEVILLDWGLAKDSKRGMTRDSALSDLESAVEDDARVATVAGKVMGTPAYMAPEQAAGDVERIGPASDVFALGGILFAILTGVPPRGMLPGEKPAEAFRRLSQEPAPLARSIRPSADPALSAIAAKAMGPTPGDRYLSAGDVGLEVRRWLAGEPVDAYAEPFAVRLRRWLLRHALFAQAMASLILLLSLLAGMAIAGTLAATREVSVVEELIVEGVSTDFARLLGLRFRHIQSELRFTVALPPVREMLAAHGKGDELKETQAADQIIAIFQAYLETHAGGPLEMGVANLVDDVVRTTSMRRDLSANPPAARLVRGRATDAPLAAFIRETAALPAGSFNLAAAPVADSTGTLAPGLFAGISLGSTDRSKLYGAIYEAVSFGDLQRSLEAEGGVATSVMLADTRGRLLAVSTSSNDLTLGLQVGQNLGERFNELSRYFRDIDDNSSFVALIEAPTPRVFACQRSTIVHNEPEKSVVLVISSPMTRAASERKAFEQQIWIATSAILLFAIAATWILLRMLVRAQRDSAAN